MATVLNRFGYNALKCTSRIPARRKRLQLAHSIRNFCPTPTHRRQDAPEDSSDPSQKRTREPFKFDINDLDRDERAIYSSLSPAERQAWQEEAKQMHDYMTSPETESELSSAVSQAAYETAEETPHSEVSIPRIKPGLMSMGEVDEQDSGEDEEFEGDDITSLGHGELEQHREMREYARIAAWEMPLLSSTFRCLHLPPSFFPCGTDDIFCFCRAG